MVSSPDLKLIGARLAEAREAAGMNQAQLAEAMRLSRGRISQWEAGHMRIPDDRLKQIAEIFGVNVQQLLNGARGLVAAPKAEPSRLTILNYTAPGFSVWHYLALGTPLAVALRPGFFREMGDMLSNGDLILITGSDDSTYRRVVVSETTRGVTLKPLAP